MGLLTAEQLTRPLPRRFERVELPEFGEDAHVFVKGFTAREKGRFETSLQNKKGNRDKARVQEVRERLLVATVCDEDGTLIMSADDVSELGNQDSGVVSRLFDVAMRLCGMSDDDVEELAGN